MTSTTAVPAKDGTSGSTHGRQGDEAVTGWLVQGVGAAWLMTTLAGTPDMVALVQTATLAPILLFALLAGALADLWDRRWVLLLAQLWVAAAAFGLPGSAPSAC